MRNIPTTRIFKEGTSATEIAERVAAILCDGHPDLHTSKKRRKFEAPPKRSIFARAAKWEDKLSLRKAIYYLEQDGMGAKDIEIIKVSAQKAIESMFATFISEALENNDKNITITDKDMVFNDVYYMGARFMGREFTPDEKVMIRQKLMTELKKEIYPRIVNAFGGSTAEEQLAELRENLARYPQTQSLDIEKAKTTPIVPDGLA